MTNGAAWAVDQSKAAIYAPYVTQQAARLLSALDREPHSRSYGSFDREHWGWKFRDFPITMLQAAVYPVALLWRFPFPDNPCHANPLVVSWIEAAIASTCRRQHRNGSFDSVGPFTQDHGVTLAMVYIFTETARVLGPRLPAGLSSLIEAAVRAGCDFALRSREDYAFISNHQALFALAFLNAHELLGNDVYRQRAAEIIERIIRRQSSDGWYREYDGADPGYESLGIFYLANYWSRTGSANLLTSIRRSIEYYAHFVHPDGSVGGVYGSRHTSLYFPAGFELLATHLPMAAAIARFMRARLACQNVVTPALSDFENLAPLAYAYLEACLTPTSDPGTSQLLPCEALDGLRHFPEAGITVAGADRYYAVVNADKGGVCRVFDKGTAKIAYEDAGYLVRAGARRWTSQLIGSGRRLVSSNPDRITCAAALAEVAQVLPTPTNYLLLRLLNLTVFRSLTLGAWVRRFITARLIRRKRRGPLQLTRSITFGTDDIQFYDQLTLGRPIAIDDVALPRHFTAIHMGSAKYFHPSELEDVPRASVSRLADGLNQGRSAACAFTLRFSATAAPALEVSPPHD